MTTSLCDVPLPALRELWRRSKSSLVWSCLFTLPTWLEAWASTLGRTAEPYLKVVRSGSVEIGVAPLAIEGETAGFLGDPEVCDYQDLVLSPGREKEAVSALWQSWSGDGIRELVLQRVRPESHVLTHLAAHARLSGAEVAVQQVASSVELPLPEDWDGYLAGLDKKRRHEIRRKLRRWKGAGDVAYRAVRTEPAAEQIMDEFFAVFRDNRDDKAAFLGPAMEAYFRALIGGAARDSLLNLGLLEFGGQMAAAALGFDYGGRTHLYNSGYRRELSDLGVGLLCMVLGLRDSIERGMKVYDFLAGDETYKFRLGGVAVPLYRCTIRFRSRRGRPT